MFISRIEELKILNKERLSNKSSFIAIYGRRRIGKTELVREFISKNKLKSIEFSGKVDMNKKQQIKSFSSKINRVFKHNRKIKDWNDAFYLLIEYLETLSKKEKIVVFLDELPWLDTAKSGFIGEFSDFWNDFCSKRSNIILIVCGSSASYMLKKIVHNRGSFHNRLTSTIRMTQFHLKDSKQLILSNGCKFSDKSITDIFMVFGGVAKYLESINCKLTPTQSINDLLFKENSLFKYEYIDLFSSLFKNSKAHYKIMNELSTKWSGYTQKELASKTKIASGYLNIPLTELEASGFIIKTTKFNQMKRDTLYRATDPFSYFYNKWMKDNKYTDWNKIVLSQSYKSWAGYAFENICHIHIDEIKDSLGISGVETNIHYWSSSDKSKDGSQIDMLIEHINGSNNIDIIECKYYNSEFTITKKYKEELIQKINVFNEYTKNKYNIRLIFITPFGVKKNEYYNELVNNDITISEFM